MRLSEQQINLLRELLECVEYDPASPTQKKVHKVLEALDGLRAQADARPVAWQWRRKGDQWSIDKTFNSEVFATTEDSEVRPLFDGAFLLAAAKAIHYPECWDTAAYPTLADALSAVYEHFRCTNEDTHPEASAPGLSDDERHALRRAADIAEEHEVIGPAHTLRAILTRASAATVGEAKPVYDCSTRNCQCDACRIERGETGPFNDDEGRTEAEAAQQQAEPSEPWREKLIELADQLDAELTTGVQWSNAQFACFYVSDDLRKIVKKAGGVPNEKDWKTRALEAEKLNRQFMERWNAENGPTHMGEPVIAAQQQEGGQ